MNVATRFPRKWIGVTTLGLAILCFSPPASPAVADPGREAQSSTSGTSKRAASKQATMPRSPNDKLVAQLRAPRLIAVRFHHDLCPFCKQLAPKYKQLMQNTDDGAILFITFDLSTETSQRQAAMLAAALGLERHWPGDYSKLASVTFVDAGTGKALTTYRPTDADPIENALAKALAETDVHAETAAPPGPSTPTDSGAKTDADD